ncbi:small ribosomal subunit protein mS42 [Diutina catenulata]
MQSVFRRGIHVVPRLGQVKQFEAAGIPGLYSAAGFQSAWTDYQQYLTTQLTMATMGTENEVRTPYQILLKTAKQTTQQHVFHYASQAHNNHFFFEQLAPEDVAKTTRPMRQLTEKLAHHGLKSVEALRDRIIEMAEAASGPGWVFLVERADKSLEVVRCNVDGTPYYYGKNQSLDFNGGVDQSSYERLEAIKRAAADSEKDFTLPLLGMSSWDQSFVHDYGVNGKREFLEKVWKCINWDVVNKRLFVV